MTFKEYSALPDGWTAGRGVTAFGPNDEWVHIAPDGAMRFANSSWADARAIRAAVLGEAAPTAAFEWSCGDLYVGDSRVSHVYHASGGWWSVASGGTVIGRGVDEPAARRLAELLAGFDPGGVWSIAGDPVTVAVVKAVCSAVAVSWGAS